MSRLIDVDKLNFEGQHYNKSQMKAILDFIDNQPTAFDVEKVVKHIEECNRIREKDMEKKIDRELRIYYEGQLFIANEIIKLIKRGGIDEN